MKTKYLKKNYRIPIALIIGESTGLLSLKKIISKPNYFINIKYVVNSDKTYEKKIKLLCNQKKIKFYSKRQFKLNKAEILKLNKKCKILISIYSNIILSKEFLKSLNYKCYNFHPGILPFYPGKNCVSGAIYNSERKIGVTIHKMNNFIDRGKILMQKKVEISLNENLLTAMTKLRTILLELLDRFIFLLRHNRKFNLKENDIKKIKNYPKVIPDSGLINEKLNYKKFQKLFNASYSGPFFNSWGRLFFKYNKEKKYINKISRKTKLIKNSKFIKKKNKNSYILQLSDTSIIVETSND